MTAEHLILLDPVDLLAMRIVCTKCRASLSLHFDETLRVPESCPVCTTMWREPTATGAPTAAEHLGKAIKAWLAIERQKTPQFSLKFELPRPSP